MTKQKFLNLSILSLLVLALLGGCSILGGKKAMEAKREAEKQEMIEIVESEEVQALIQKKIDYYNNLVEGEEKPITSYEVDYDSLEYHPMGGIIIKIIMNDIPEQYVSIDVYIDKDGNYHHSGSVVSEGLRKLLLSYSQEETDESKQ
ncbi:DUF1310 family protein [Streptococcus caprae]|uniref:DUF1310 family protein n=1 Tax=Streptococcus caprae TaxID=1640501 RepID=A0ABV8CT34_9STRE